MEQFPGPIRKKWITKERKSDAKRKGVVKSECLVLNRAQRAWLCQWFPTVENSILQQEMGISHSSLHRLARRLKLTKSAEGLHGILSRTAQENAKRLEARGYYESLRGKGPSQRSLEGTARMWEEIRAGKRELPLDILKRRDPDKYANRARRIGEAHRAMIRRERMRIACGLPRKTQLRTVVENPYTSRQRNHRYNALKHGYFVMKDCTEAGGERYNIYYDQDTQRSERLERNLIADGFHLREWTA